MEIKQTKGLKRDVIDKFYTKKVCNFFNLFTKWVNEFKDLQILLTLILFKK